MPEDRIRFKIYPFNPGQRIFIEDGPRQGDWIITMVNEKKIGLRCPVTGVQVTWNRFCYTVKDSSIDMSTED